MRGHSVCFYGKVTKLSQNYSCFPFLSEALGMLCLFRPAKPEVKVKKFSKSFYQQPARPAEPASEPKPNLLINDGNFMERFKQMQSLKAGQTQGLYAP